MASRTTPKKERAGWYSLLPGEPPTWAPYVYFKPGEHEQAFTPEECARLLAYADKKAAVKGSIRAGELDSTVRDADVRCLGVEPGTMWFFDRLMECVTAANGWWNFSLTHLLNVEVLRYGPGQHYKQHVDLGSGFATRKISVVVMLSDPADYKGGDLEIITGSPPDKMTKDQGTVVCFPSWTLHRVTPVKSGVRRTVTGWVQGPTFT